MLGLFVEPQPRKDSGRPRWRAMGIDQVEAFMHFGNLGRVAGFLGTRKKRNPFFIAASTISKGVVLPPGASWAT